MGGDLVSINVMKLIMRFFLSKATGSAAHLKDAFGNLHRVPYVNLILIDAAAHVAHAFFLLAFAIAMGFGFLFYLPVSLFASKQLKKALYQDVPESVNLEIAPIEPPGVPRYDQGADFMVGALWHISIHCWWWLLVDAVLLLEGPRNLRAMALGLLYLFLSELFFSGFLLHPYLGFWLGSHGTGAGQFGAGTMVEGDNGDVRGASTHCQPTMSTYSCFSGLLTGNLTYHVEHHDFPKCPWTRLPQITMLAPEFYTGLRKSCGLRHTITEYLKHGHGWRYGCLVD